MPEFGFDDWIDAQLRNVPLPANLLARLAEGGPGRAADDAHLDSALRSVPVPANLQVRLRRIARRGQPSLWRQVGLAASLFLAISLAAVGYLAVLSGMFAPQRAPLAQKPAPAASSATASSATVPSATVPSPPAGRVARPDSPAAPTDAGPALAADRSRVGQRNSPGRAASAVSTPVTLSTDPDAAELDSVASDTAAASRQAPAALGASGTLDRGPDLDTFDLRRARGVAPLLVRGYDLMFQLKYGEHPFVAPAADKAFVTARMPFGFDTASYDMALCAVRGGQLPATDEIRVEEFLAAQDYPLPPAPAGGLALHVAGSLHPFGSALPKGGMPSLAGGSLHLLQLAVQAASYDAQTHYPNRLIVAVDMSSQMRASARFEAVRRALVKLADHMSDGDRVTLVRFAEASTVLAAEASADELKTLASSDALSAPRGTANLTAAIESVCQTAGAGESLDPRQVVVITAERGNFEPTALPKSSQQLGELTERNIPWQMIRVAADANDAHWDELAGAARGKVAAARAPAEIYSLLLEALTGWSTTVASGTSLTLTFDPHVVQGYRLLGHEAPTLTGLSADPLSIDLRADQTATAMYELSIKPGNVEPIGSVELAWDDPATGQPQRIRQPITRNQLNGSFSAAPAWFQGGVIAAKGAEVLRNSYYAPVNRPLAQVLDLAGQVDSRVAGRPDFQQLVNLLKKAEKLR